ncbi:hypothetical protein RSAG8_02961, partial [Rhizoctonia solani AG-8 WAC10335]
SGSRNILARATQRLRSLVSAVQNMSCTGTCGGRGQELNRSQLYPNSHIREKRASAPKFEAQRHTPTLGIVKQAKCLSSGIHEQVSWMDSPQNNAHTPAPLTSTNMAYKPSALFSDETLQFANAFLPPMAPLKIRVRSTSVENSAKPPPTNWIRRHTCIRPGNVIQIPSVSDKGAIYLLSCQNESELQCEVDLGAENNQSQKLFIAQADGDAEQPLGYSRAFIMCKPGSEL